MQEVQREMLCVLLQDLLDQGLIGQEIFEKARCRILDARTFPEFFYCDSCNGKERTDASM